MGTSKMAVNHLRIISRGLSTSVGRLQLVQPPVQVFGIEGRYATALYSAATKKKALAAVEKDLKTFEATLKKDARLADFLADPSVKKADLIWLKLWLELLTPLWLHIGEKLSAKS